VDNENVVEFKASKDNKTFVYTYTGSKKEKAKAFSSKTARRIIKSRKVRRAVEAWVDSEYFPKLEGFPYEKDTYTHLVEWTMSSDERSVDIIATVSNVTYTETMRQETTSYLNTELALEIDGEELKLTTDTEALFWSAEDPSEEEEEEGDEDEEDFDGEEEEECEEDEDEAGSELISTYKNLLAEGKEVLENLLLAIKAKQ
jgi:hypothetical protein